MQKGFSFGSCCWRRQKKKGIEPFVCSATQILNESCILSDVVGDSLIALCFPSPSGRLLSTTCMLTLPDYWSYVAFVSLLQASWYRSPVSPLHAPPLPRVEWKNHPFLKHMEWQNHPSPRQPSIHGTIHKTSLIHIPRSPIIAVSPLCRVPTLPLMNYPLKQASPYKNLNPNT